MDGAFPLGSQLGEAPLATQLQVSRGPLRKRSSA
jgi:DNA-binding GntR family transcriptional regulator